MPDEYRDGVFQNALHGLQEIYLPNEYGYQYPMANPLSPYTSCSDSLGNNTSASSPMSITLSPGHTCLTLNNATDLGTPHISILEQPVERFRFRYKSEMMGTHGSLVGASSASTRKKHAPTVQLNFPDGMVVPDRIVIRCTLVTADEDQRVPHAHRLVRREGLVDHDDPHEVDINPDNRFIASFYGMGIVHTAKKYIKDELVRKLRVQELEKLKQKNVHAELSVREDAQIKANAELYQKTMNLNSVALCFQAFTPNENCIMIPITGPVYSNPINNLKSTLTGELKICRIDKTTSTCEGGEEVFILVEKVGKKNIKVKFFELNEDNHEIWADYGRFSELDVHHQYAIVFRTPPYKDLNITSPREVFIQLERPSDAVCSDAKKFTYKPSDRNMGRKRARMSHSNSAELARVMICNTPPLDESNVTFDNDSNELKKMLADRCSSSELANFVADFDFDRYIQRCCKSEENVLTCDGPAARRDRDDAMFARNVIFEAIKIIKLNAADKKETLQKLFKDRSTYGDSPLHAALRHSQWEIAKYILIIIGGDRALKELVNLQNSSGKTPLHYAVLQNQPELTRALLVLGADPNMCDDRGSSALHAAVMMPHAGACVDTLLSEKITNVEAYNDDGWTPLQLAAEAGSYDAVRSLAKSGADVNSTEKSYGRTVLHIAVEGGHIDIVEFLLNETKIDVNKRNFSGNTALHSAVVNPGARAKELCKLLMTHQANPYIQNHDRESGSTDKRKVQTIDIKVEVCSDEENTGESGQTSFDLASNKPEILQLLTGEQTELQIDAEIKTIPTKQETMDTESDNMFLDNEQKTNLSVLLDKSQAWEKLAECLKIGYLINTFRGNSTSPSMCLLNYMDVQGISLNDMQHALQDIGAREASTLISNVLSAQ